MKYFSVLFLGLLLFSVAIAQATVGISGRVTLAGQVEAPSNLIIGGSGTIAIATIGEHTGNPTGSAPYVDVLVDALPVSIKAGTFSSLAVGTHTARSERRHGLVMSVGSCTYPENGTVCTVSTFTPVPESNCDLDRCFQTVTVSAGQVTRVVFRHQGAYQGWGASTVGGREGTLVTVTNVNPSGAGSFRQALLDACQSNNRYITFNVGGTIALPYVDTGGLKNGLKICGNQITVDGFTAPDPGITVTQYGLNIHVLDINGVPKDTHDIILRGFRVRRGGFSSGFNCSTPPYDCETQAVNIETGSSGYGGPFVVNNLVLDHMSISGSTDDMIGPSRRNINLTFSWNYLSAATGSNQGYLQDSGTNQVSIHHNRWTRSARRNPQATHHNGNPGSTETTVPAVISADVRLNTVVAFKETPANSHWGLLVAAGAKANAVKNYFTTDSTITTDSYGVNNSLIVCNPGSRWLNSGTMNAGCDFCCVESGNCSAAADACRRSSNVFVDGNVFLNPFGPAAVVNMNNLDVNQSSPITSPAITEEATATLGACAVRQRGGFRPLDAHDLGQESAYANPCT